MKIYWKKWLGFFLMFVLIVTSVSAANRNRKEARAASNLEEGTFAYVDIRDTAGTDAIKAERNEYLDMGQLSNEKDFFMFQVSCPDVTDREENFKIGFYNTSAKNPWADGYLLSLNTSATKGTVGWLAENTCPHITDGHKAQPFARYLRTSE